jgi:cyclic pyranopterin phosphate synthase
MSMVDVSEKGITKRTAVVAGTVFTKKEVIQMIKNKQIPKGDVLESARLAGILAAKKTSDLIPLCHPIGIDFVEIEFTLQEERINIKTRVKGEARTGVEMEAFTATALSALTIYDMCKAFDKEMVIGEIRLIEKTGGKSKSF